MRTITIRDLRQHWPEAEAALQVEDEIIVTRDSQPVAKLVPVHQQPALDLEKRRRAVQALTALRDELSRAHGTMTTDEIVRLVRDAREERAEQIWRNATGDGPT